MAGVFGGRITSYNPTPAEKAGNWAYDIAQRIGAGKYAAQTARNNVRDIVGFLPGIALGDYLARKATGQSGGTSGIEASLDAADIAPIGKIAGAAIKPVLAAAKPVAGMFGKAVAAKAPALAMFLGAGAKNADLAALKAAERMASEGADRRAIWNATGWFKGADDKWRFEIDDRFANVDVKGFPEPPHMGSLTNKASRELYGKSFMELAPNSPERMKAQDIARMQANEAYSATIPSSEIVYHPELMRAYEGFPSFGRNRKPGFGGYYDEINNQIRISDPELGRAGNPTSTGLHELQHFVQGREKFATGGNVTEFLDDQLMENNNKLSKISSEIEFIQNKLGLHGFRPPHPELNHLYQEYDDILSSAVDEAAAYDKYKRLAGETEARNVEARMGMTMPERMATPPWETQDVPFEQQIVRFGSGSSSMMANPARPGGMFGKSAEKAPSSNFQFTPELVEIANRNAKTAPVGVIGAIENDAMGVVPGVERNLDWRINQGRFSIDEAAAPWQETRDYLKSVYGDKVSLWRADSPESVKTQKNITSYFGDEKLARQFEGESYGGTRVAKQYDINVDDILGIYTHPSGYNEVIVKWPPRNISK